jgi:hypothetical protein
MSSSKFILFIVLWPTIILVILSMISETEASLTDNLKYFETIRSSDLSHNIVKRGVDPSR